MNNTALTVLVVLVILIVGMIAYQRGYFGDTHDSAGVQVNLPGGTIQPAGY